MLIKIDRTGKTKSIFKCDRCGKEIVTDINERYRISVHKTPRGYSVIKGWDLCSKCYAALNRGIEKGVDNK